MLSMPYLLLFVAAIGLQILYYVKGSGKAKTAGHIVGLICGLYITFMIWLYAGFGEGSSYRVLYLVNGRPLYSGAGTIIPVVVFGLILAPLLCWLPLGIAYMLTHFIEDGAATILPETQVFKGFVRGWCILSLVFIYLCVGFIPFFLMTLEIEESPDFTTYLNDHFLQFSFCGPLLATWLLVGIRYLANLIVSISKKSKKS